MPEERVPSLQTRENPQAGRGKPLPYKRDGHSTEVSALRFLPRDSGWTFRVEWCGYVEWGLCDYSFGAAGA
jgi:hypothetical protein